MKSGAREIPILHQSGSKAQQKGEKREPQIAEKLASAMRMRSAKAAKT
jgi:hypothetical protein